MSIIRQRLVFEDRFTIMPNDWARDSRLTLRARGLLVQLLSHREGWEITIESLVRDNPEGRDAIRGAIKELEQAGYLERHRQVDPKTKKFGGMDYLLVEPKVGIPDAGIPAAGEGPTKNTIHRTPSKNEDPLHDDLRSSDPREVFHDGASSAAANSEPTTRDPNHPVRKAMREAIMRVAHEGNHTDAHDDLAALAAQFHGDLFADFILLKCTFDESSKTAYGAGAKLNTVYATAVSQGFDVENPIHE